MARSASKGRRASNSKTAWDADFAGTGGPGAGSRLNKRIAGELGTTDLTIKVRGLVMRKMSADSLADLVRIADKLKISV